MGDQQLAVIEKIKNLKGPIFIFGASGFIGANLFDTIFGIRKDCYALTHDSSRAWRLKLLNVPYENIIHCDILSRSSVRTVFELYRPKTIFNLAAYGAYSKQTEENLIYETNVLGTLNILELCTELSTYIHAGSSSEYGFNSAAPKEDGVLTPNSHYSVSKISASYLIQYYAKLNAVNAINLRLYSVYGPWEEPDRLIPRLIENARKGTLPKMVDAEISRDFIYVSDAVEAFVDAALSVSAANRGSSFNIASGKKTTMGELVELIRTQCQIKEQGFM